MFSKFFTAIFITLSFCSFSAVSVFAEEEGTKSTNNNPQVRVTTSSGEFILELYPKEAPITVANFLEYVDSGFYNGTIFHRVIPNFMAQAGGHRFDFTKKETREPIQNESDNGLKNEEGTIAMARTGFVHSATAQFFINYKYNDFLDGSKDKLGYAVFGKVISGFEVLKKIEKEPQGLFKGHGFPNAPNAAVTIIKMERIQAKP